MRLIMCNTSNETASQVKRSWKQVASHVEACEKKVGGREEEEEEGDNAGVAFSMYRVWRRQPARSAGCEYLFLSAPMRRGGTEEEGRQAQFLISTARGHQRHFIHTSDDSINSSHCDAGCYRDRMRWEGRIIGCDRSHGETPKGERSRTCRTTPRQSGSRCRCPWLAWSAGICCPAGGWWYGPAKNEQMFSFSLVSRQRSFRMSLYYIFAQFYPVLKSGLGKILRFLHGFKGIFCDLCVQQLQIPLN